MDAKADAKSTIEAAQKTLLAEAASKKARKAKCAISVAPPFRPPPNCPCGTTDAAAFTRLGRCSLLNALAE
eukprot:12085483-Heterocapsa_arctica.AAC.1